MSILSKIFSNKTSVVSLKEKILAYSKGKTINVLEAGAAGGEDTIEWAQLVKKGMVYAFEPVPKSFDVVKSKVRHLPNVQVHELALSDRSGETTIHISSNEKQEGSLPTSSSILPPLEHTSFHPHIKFNETLTVKVSTIDSWAKENRVEKIDIMWLDMQGGEMAALKGAEEIIKTTQVIYTEVSLKPMYDQSPLYPEFKAWMDKQGFKVAEEFLEWEDMGNVIFIRK